MKLLLHEPKIEELWFRKLMLEDEETMSYNNDFGGTISFPEEDWQDWFDYWITNHKNKRYYRYLKTEDGIFVGEIAYHYDSSYNGHIADVIIHSKYRNNGYGSLGLKMLCDVAKENGLVELFDDIAINNGAIKMFLNYGFVELYRTDSIILLKKEL